MSAEHTSASSASRRIRVLVIALVLVVAGGAGLAMWRSHEESSTASLLFTVQGGKAHVVADPDVPMGYRLLVQDVDPEAMWFTDRPERDGGQVPVAVVVQEWAAYGFDADPPNAALVAGPLTTRPATALVELGHPVYDPTRAAMIVDVRFVGDASGLRPTNDLEPLAIGAVSLFIDDAEVPLVPAASAVPTPPAPASAAPAADAANAQPSTAPAEPTDAASTSANATSTDATSTDATATGPTSTAPASTTSAPAPVSAAQPTPAPLATTTPPASAPSGQTSIIIPTDAAAWTYHSFVLPSAEDKYVAKININDDNIDQATGQFIYSFNASSLVEGFSDYHLHLADSTNGIHLQGVTNANDL